MAEFDPSVGDIDTGTVNPIEAYVYSKYSPNKQAQDLMWTNYHRTNLIAQGVTDLEKKIVTKALLIKGGKTLKEVLSDVKDEHKNAFDKLLKVALRTTWAESCIKEYISATTERRKAIFPEFTESIK
jgi:hypothetical protein